MTKENLWYDTFEIGDTIRYDLNVNYIKTGHTKDFILTKELLASIKRDTHDLDNFHNMRVIKQVHHKNTK